MPTTISNNVGGNRTLTYTKTAPSDKILNVLDDAVHYLFNHGYGDHGTEEVPRTYEDQSITEKAQMLDEHLTRVIREAAESYHVNDAIEVARLAAIAEADFDLGQGIM